MSNKYQPGWLGWWTDEKVKCPRKYFSRDLKIPLPRSQKRPCEYSARGAKIQPRFSHSDDQGNFTKQVFAARKVCRNTEIKSKKKLCKNYQPHHSGEQEGLRQRSSGGHQRNITGRRQIRRRGPIIWRITRVRECVQRGGYKRERFKGTITEGKEHDRI